MPHLSSYQTEKKVISLPNRLPCRIAAVEVVGQDRHERADHQLKHGCAPFPSARSMRRDRSRRRSASGRLGQRAQPGVASAIRSTELAMLRNGVPKSGRSIMASKQTGDPEDVHVGEKRDQAENGDDFELQLVRLVRHAFRQAVQFPVQRTDPENDRYQKNARHHYQCVRAVRSGNKKRQMMRGCRMHLVAQCPSPLPWGAAAVPGTV